MIWTFVHEINRNLHSRSYKHINFIAALEYGYVSLEVGCLYLIIENIAKLSKCGFDGTVECSC